MARTLKLVNGETYAIPALEKELKLGDTIEVESDKVADLLLEDEIIDSNNNVKPYFEEVDGDAAPSRARARKPAPSAAADKGDKADGK